MTNRYIWIGITIGVFAAGIGIGYAIFMNTYNPYGIMMQPQFFNQMMGRNPQFAGQYMGYMMQNPQYMNQWFSQNPQYTGQWMSSMMQDPQLRQQMYSYMFQNQQFMHDMMQNPQFQKQWVKPVTPSQLNSTGVSPTNTSPGFNMGSGMMGGGYNQAFKTISIKDAEASTQLPSYAQVSKESNTITLNSQSVDIIPLSFGGDEAKNFTGTSLPSYAKDDVFIIGKMIDPTLVVKAGTQLNVTSINLDEDMAHSFVIMTTAPPYSYMPMQSMMYGGVVAMMPVLPNDDVKDGYAYELSYQVTLLQPGTYWYVCTYPGHARDGMYGKIIVQ